MPVFTKRSVIPAAPGDVFAWHERPDALARLIPPWDRVEIVRPPASLRDGERAVLRVGLLGPLTVRWIAEHRDYEPGRRFTDVQIRGPFKCWRHVHTFEPTEDGACALEDRVEYRLRGGPIADAALSWVVRRKLEKTFAYRHAVTADAFAR